ncbi:MAG: outer membrane protein assembly factor BamB family protein [Armatimonadota bacterium]
MGALKTTTALLTFLDDTGAPVVFPGYMGSTLVADLTTKPANIWKVIINAQDAGTLSVRGADGKVYPWRNIPATTNPTLYDITIDRLVQQIIWTVPTPTVGREPGDFQVFERDTAFGGGRIYAFDANNGSIKWQFPAAGQPALSPIASSPTLSPEGETLFIGTTGGSVFAFRSSDGTLLWRREVFQALFSPLVLVANPGGADLFAPDLEGNLHLWHGATGLEMSGWPLPAQGPCENAGAVTAENQAYLVSSHGRVYYLNLNARNYGSRTLTVPTTDPNGAIWSENTLLYDPSSKAVTVVGRIKPQFTDGLGAPLTDYLAASGGQSVRLGFRDSGGGNFTFAYLTDNGQVGIDGLAPVNLPAGTKPADGLEIALTVRVDSATQYRIYGVYRTIDTAGNFSGQFQSLGQGVINGTPPQVYPFLQGIDIDAPGFAPQGRDITLYTGYAPAGAGIYGPLATVVNETQTNVFSNPVLDSLGHLFYGAETGSLFCLRPETEWAAGANPVLWQYQPDRSIIYTSLYEAAVPGQTNLKVTTVTGFRVGDPVQVARPDGSLPEDLGTIISITPKPDPYQFDLSTAAPEAPATQLHVTVPAASLASVLPGYNVYLLPPPDPATGTQQMAFVGLVVSVNTATGLVTLDRPVEIPGIDYNGDGNTDNDLYPVVNPPGITQVYIERPYGYISVSNGPSMRREAGDLLRLMRGQAMPMRSSPSLGPLQTVYVGAQDGLLYAIGPAGPAGDPPALPELPIREETDIWWTFHHDNQRTGFVERPGAYYDDLRWYRDTGSTLESSPALGYADATAPLGVLYQGTVDTPSDVSGQSVSTGAGGALISYDASSGNLRWLFDDDGNMGKIISSPAVYISERTDASGQIVKDELVVVGTMDYPKSSIAGLLDASVDVGGVRQSLVNDLLRVSLLRDDQVIALRLSDAVQFSPGMELFLTNSDGSNFENCPGVVAFVRGQWVFFSEVYTDFNRNGQYDPPEAYTDVNGNGQYDLGEPYTDSNGNGQRDFGEPYIDGNGNGQYDATEPFTDSNGNGSRDATELYTDLNGNGQWDYMAWPVLRLEHVLANTLVHAQTSQQGHLYAVDRAGQMHWKFPTDDTPLNQRISHISSSPVIDGFGNTYFCTEEGIIYALDLDGNLMWQYAVPRVDETEISLGIISSPALDEKGTRLYVGIAIPDTNKGYLLALDLVTSDDDKRLVWKVPLEGPVTASPTITKVDGIDRIFIGTDDYSGDFSAGNPLTSQFYCIDPADGSTVVSVPTEPIYSTAAAVPESSTSYYVITSVNAGTNKINVADTTGLLAGMRIKVRSATDTLEYVISAVDDQTTITVEPAPALVQTKNYLNFRINEQMLFVGTLGGKMLAFTENLELLHFFPTGGPIRTSPAVSTEPDIDGQKTRGYFVYFGSNDYKFYSLTATPIYASHGGNTYGDTLRIDSGRGFPKNLRDRIYASPVIGMRTSDADSARAVVYQASRDHYIYAFGDQVGYEGPPQNPSGPTNPYTPPETTGAPRVPSTIRVTKSAEFVTDRTADPRLVADPPGGNWWKFIVTVRNTGRGLVDNLFIYDTLPAGLCVPFNPLDAAATTPFSVGLQADEKLQAPTNRGTDPLPVWELKWTTDTDGGFALKPYLGDPTQPRTEYMRTFIFYAPVAESQAGRDYPTLGTKLKVTLNQAVMSNSTEDTNKNAISRYFGDTGYLQMFRHPVPNTAGGKTGMNELYVTAKTYDGDNERDLEARTQTPVSNDWTDRFKLRLYYNGFSSQGKLAWEGYDTDGKLPGENPRPLLTPYTNPVRAFASWNQTHTERGEPMGFKISTDIIADGRERMPANLNRLAMRSFTDAAAGTAVSGVQFQLWPRASRFDTLMNNMGDIRFTGMVDNAIIPFGWRVSMQQGKAQIGQRIVKWGPESGFVERVIRTQVTAPGGVNVNVTYTSGGPGTAVVVPVLNDAGQLSRVKEGRVLLFEDTTPAGGVEGTVTNIINSVPDGSITITLNYTVNRQINLNSPVLEEWSADLLVQNPMRVPDTITPTDDLQGVTLGGSTAPGNTATSAPLAVKNVTTGWNSSGAVSGSQRMSTLLGQNRFMLAPFDLNVSSGVDWNNWLLTHADKGYPFGEKPLAGSDWDGFRYDPYGENAVKLNRFLSDLPSGAGLNANQSLMLHLTRRVPAHQGFGVYRTDDEDTDTSVDIPQYELNPAFDGVRHYFDIDGNGYYDAGEPCLAQGLFDLRVFLDMNGSEGWDAGEPYFVLSSTTVGDKYAFKPNIFGTTLDVASLARLFSPNTVVDMGRQSVSSPYSLPVKSPTLVNPGNTVLGDGAGNTKLLAAPSMVVTDDPATGTVMVASAVPGQSKESVLLRTGKTVVGYNPLTQRIELRHANEIQPFQFTHLFPDDWALLKSPAGAEKAFSRPFALPITMDYRQPTGTYTSGAVVRSKDAYDNWGSDTMVLSLRAGETRLSQVVPAPGPATPPPFDYSRQTVAQVAAGKMTNWTNYLTGVENFPATALLRLGAGPEDLGVWVSSNTPLIPVNASRPIDTGTIPTRETDSNIWFRRVKHLVTEPKDNAGALQDIVFDANGNATITVPQAIFDQVRVTDDITSDLVLLRAKQLETEPANLPGWYGRITQKSVQVLPTDPTTITVEKIDGIQTNPDGSDAWPKDKTMVEILAHPWIPVLSQAEMDSLRDTLRDPSSNKTGNKPVPIHCSTPLVTPADPNTPGSQVWLTWTVTATRRITRAGQEHYVPTSYLAYKFFDAANPTANTFFWVGPPDQPVQFGMPAPMPVRERPLLLPDVVGLDALLLYDGGMASERGLYYAAASRNPARQTLTTTAAVAQNSLEIEVLSTARLQPGMMVTIQNATPFTARVQQIVSNTRVRFTEVVRAEAGRAVTTSPALAKVTAAGNSANLVVDTTALIVEGMTVVINNATYRVVQVMNAQTIKLDRAVVANVGDLVNTYWAMDASIDPLNWAFTAAGGAKAWADSVNGAAQSPMRKINLVFQGRSEAGNTDVYYARAFVNAASAKPVSLQPLIQSGAEPTTGNILETLQANDTGTVFTGSPRAWRLLLDPTDTDTPVNDITNDLVKSLTVYVEINSSGVFEKVRFNRWMDLPTPPPVAPSDLPDSTREYILQFVASARTYRLAFDPYRNKVRVVVQPATPADKITKILVKGQPRLQRLTTNLAPDIYPLVSVERWRFYDTTTSTYNFGNNNSLLTSPRIWLYWVRKHEDGLGSRVYYRTLRMRDQNAIPDPANPAIIRLDNETRDLNNRTNIDMPERMLPMEVLAQDGMVSIARQSAGPNSPEAGLWVVSSASRDLFPSYPDPSVTLRAPQKTEHDVFLQIINVPVPENN